MEVSQGRAVLGSTGSASVWSRSTGNETALIVGAVHSLGQGWFGAEGTAIAEAIVDPADQVGIPRLFLLLPDGSAPDTLASPWFGLFNPSIAAERNGNLMQDVLPREDFYVAVTDAQKLDVSGLPPVPEPITGGPVPLHDPAEVTMTRPTHSAARPGELVLMLGYANETGRLTASVGRVLGDADASAAVATLAGLGDPEGSIDYDSDAEIIIEGAAVAGMSGGPVVDGEGRLIAVLVRASEDHDGVQFARAVRMTHVVSRLDAAIEELGPEQQLAVAGYLER
ncbi:MAG: trypsin-like peptidase domain-containing protein [Acidimicrobiia bacterium]|nr:trypsin-like peptidase domain-containing protein [Acidimicrobiia bacterium]